MYPEENQHHQSPGFNTYKTLGRQIQFPSDQFEGASCFSWGFPSDAIGKELSCRCRRHKRLGSIPGLGRSPGVGKATKRIPMDRGAWWATVHSIAKSRTPLKQLRTHISFSCRISGRSALTISLCISAYSNLSVSYISVPLLHPIPPYQGKPGKGENLVCADSVEPSE